MRHQRLQSIFILFCIAASFSLLKLVRRCIGDGLQKSEAISYLLLKNNTTKLENTSQDILQDTVGFEVNSSFQINAITGSDGGVVVKDSGRSEQQLCSREEVKDGIWIPVTLEKPPYITKTTHLRCYPLDDYKKGVWNTYEWKPHADCKLTSWSRSLFCSLLERATILIIGDSLSWEHYSSLGQMLGLRVHQTSQHDSRIYQQNHVQFACNNKVRLVFRRDDKLRNITDALRNTFPQVIVMNRGAHYVNDTSLISDLKNNFDEIKEWQMTCKQLGMKCHFLWRTTVPGHPLCNTRNYTKPVNNLQEMESLIADPLNYNSHTINYHWQDYQHQNELVLKMLSDHYGTNSGSYSISRNSSYSNSTSSIEYDIMDAYYLNVLRPDEHRAHQKDCLHNCYPGKMDVYNRLLLHYVRMRRSKYDTQRQIDRYNEAMKRIGLTSD